MATRRANDKVLVTTLKKVKVTKNFVRYEGDGRHAPIPNLYIDSEVVEATGLGDEITVTVE